MHTLTDQKDSQLPLPTDYYGSSRLRDVAAPSACRTPAAGSGGTTQDAGLVHITNKSDALTINRLDQTKRMRRMARVVRAAAKAMVETELFDDRRQRPAFITLTYRPGVEWAPKDISRCMECYKAWLERRGYRLHAIWVAELTKKGVVHYHIVVWLPRGLTPPKPDKQGWWPHGMTNVQWAKKPIAYLAKYTSKGINHPGKFPKGCRLFGIYRCPIYLGYWRCPAWLIEYVEPGTKITCKKGWWIDWERGYGFKSPWVVDKITSATVSLHWRGWTEDDIVPIDAIEIEQDQRQAFRRAYFARNAENIDPFNRTVSPGPDASCIETGEKRSSD